MKQADNLQLSISEGLADGKGDPGTVGLSRVDEFLMPSFALFIPFLERNCVSRKKTTALAGFTSLKSQMDSALNTLHFALCNASIMRKGLFHFTLQQIIRIHLPQEIGSSRHAATFRENQFGKNASDLAASIYCI